MKKLLSLSVVIFVALSLFVVLPSGKVLASQCNTVINFDAKPNPVGETQTLVFSGTVSLSGFESDGFCLDRNGNSVKGFSVTVYAGALGNPHSSTINAVANNGEPYPFSISVKPSDKNVHAGQSVNAYATVYSTASGAASLVTSSTITINVSRVIFGCVAADGKYSCSPGNLSNCSDVSNNACQDRACIVIPDASQCGSTAPTSATHKECQNNACRDVAGAQLNIGAKSCATDADCGGGTTTNNSSNFSLENPLGITNFQDLIGIIGTWIFNLAIPVAIIIIIYAGIMMLTAGPNPKNFETGKNALKYAVIGLAVVLIGKGFVSLIQSILNLKNG